MTAEEKAKSPGLKALFRILNWSVAGVDPVVMGVGPVESTHRLFPVPKTGRAKSLDFNKIDLIEIHEAFASQVLSVFKESERKYGLKWNPDKVNVYGRSLAYTHPLGATNFRLLANLLSRFD